MSQPGGMPHDDRPAGPPAAWRGLLLILVVLGSAYVVWRVRPVVITLFLAAVLAYIMRPLAGWMMRQTWFAAIHNVATSGCMLVCRPAHLALCGIRHTMPKPLAKARLTPHVLRSFATLYTLALLLGGFYYTVVFLADPFVREARAVQQEWPSHVAGIRAKTTQARKWYTSHISPDWRQWIEQRVARSEGVTQMQGKASEALGQAIRHIAEWARYIVELILLPVLAFYFALDSLALKNEFVSLVPATKRRDVLLLIREFNGIMFSYVAGQGTLCVIAGIVVGTGLWLLHVPYPLTLGLLAGITRAIPIIGPILGGIPIVALTLNTAGFTTALGVLAFFTILHFAESKFLMPILIGDRMRLHPVVIIVVLLVGQEFGGLLGMFFAPPVAALVRVIIRRYWLRLGRRVPVEGQPA